jgi:hypothetical protein
MKKVTGDGGSRLGHSQTQSWVCRDPQLSLSVTQSLGQLSSPVSAITGGLLFGYLIGCFVLILSFYIFLKMLRCQLVSGGQKTHHLCHDRIVAALLVHACVSSGVRVLGKWPPLPPPQVYS